MPKFCTLLQNETLISGVLNDLLFEIGLNSNALGFRCLIDSVKLCCKDREMLIGITKQLYNDVAELQGITDTGVERNIRYLIGAIKQKNMLHAFYDRINLPVAQRKIKLTNKRLISILVWYIERLQVSYVIIDE